MKVKVYAPGFLTQEQLNSQGTVTLPDKSTLDDLYHLLHIPDSFRFSLFCIVNDKKTSWETQLKDNDSVNFMYPMPGG